MVSKEFKGKEKVYRCVTCGEEISKEDFEEHEGQCFNCWHEDVAIASTYNLPDEMV